MVHRCAFIGVILLVASPSFGLSVRDKAVANIERYRKADATVEVRDAVGRPVEGATVRVHQIAHDFRFGNYIRPRHYDNPQYLERFAELFNFVELLEFNWGQYEPDEGKPLLPQRMDFIRGWCAENGYDAFYGHMLTWTRQYGEYPRTGLPLWLFDHDEDERYPLLEKRIEREVTDYRDIDIVWDVVNEATHCRVWGDWDKDSYVQNRQAEPMERIAPYVRDTLTWARQANPDARLLINDYRVIIKGPFQDRYRQLLDTLIAQKASPDVVGIQAHEPYKGKYWFSPQELWDAYDLLGTQTGLPIYITELFYVSDSAEDIRGDYRQGKWSESRQADAIEEFYRISFGHPSIEAIIYFGLPDSDVVQPSCGLLDENYQPKPAWDRLKKLIHGEWTTDVSGKTDADGIFTFNGFHGRYEVTVRTAQSTRQVKTHLQKDSPNQWIIRLEPSL